jgi:hypothetical protein
MKLSVRSGRMAQQNHVSAHATFTRASDVPDAVITFGFSIQVLPKDGADPARAGWCHMMILNPTRLGQHAVERSRFP